MEVRYIKDGVVYTEDIKTLIKIENASYFKGLIPHGVEVVQDYAFAESTISNIEFPDSIKYLGTHLFEKSLYLKSVKLPSKIKKLSPYMFAECSVLEQVEMPYEIESLEEGMFKNCASLKDIPFRAGIKELPSYVFYGCKGINSLIIPNSVEKICSYAVAECENLVTLVLPDSLKEIEEHAFDNCNKISHIRISSDNLNFSLSEDGTILYKNNQDGSQTLVLELNNKTYSEVPFVKEDLVTEDSFEETEVIEDNEVIEESSEQIEEDISKEEVIENKQEEVENQEDLSQKLKDILGQNSFSNFSIEDIPCASKEEIEEGKLNSLDIQDDVENKEVIEEKTEEIAVLSQQDESIEETLLEEPIVEDLSEQVEEDLISEKLEELETEVESIETEEVLLTIDRYIDYQKKLEIEFDSAEQKELYVFAHKIDKENNFSEKLISCCKRLATVQDFSKIIIFYKIDIKDKTEFENFIKQQNVLISCNTNSFTELEEEIKDLCNITDVKLDKDIIKEQTKAILEKTDKLIKMLVQDEI